MDKNGKEMPGVTPEGTPREVPQPNRQDVPEMPRKEMPDEDPSKIRSNPNNISEPDISGGVC